MERGGNRGKQRKTTEIYLRTLDLRSVPEATRQGQTGSCRGQDVATWQPDMSTMLQIKRHLACLYFVHHVLWFCVTLER